MNTGTRACADAAPDGYTICITNADAMLYNQFLFKNLPFNPETSLQPITNAFHLIHMLVVNSQARREDRRRAGRAVEAEGRHAELSRAGRAAGALHGDAEEGEGRRLGARAVPRRRRGGQRHHERLDADRAVRRGQRDRQRPRRPDDAAGDDEQHPLAEFPGRAAARPRSATTARRREAGTASSRRPARRRPIVDRRQQGHQRDHQPSRSSATGISPRAAWCRRPTRRSSSPPTSSASARSPRRWSRTRASSRSSCAGTRSRSASWPGSSAAIHVLASQDLKTDTGVDARDKRRRMTEGRRSSRSATPPRAKSPPAAPACRPSRRGRTAPRRCATTGRP